MIKYSKGKVVYLNEVSRNRRRERPVQSNEYARMMAVTSGKGGVGKTNIVTNLGFALSKIGAMVTILDADVGLGNLDLLLGMTPKYNLSHVLAGHVAFEDIIIEVRPGMRIIPASSGIQEMTRLTNSQKIAILEDIEKAALNTDFFFIDTAAGISSNVTYFNSAADEVIVVVSPEPTSITDAYALMKVMSYKDSDTVFKLIVNKVKNEDEAKEIYRQLKFVTDRFINIPIEMFGWVSNDKHMTACVRKQSLICEAYPESDASKCINSMAKKLNTSPPAGYSVKRKILLKSLMQSNGN